MVLTNEEYYFNIFSIVPIGESKLGCLGILGHYELPFTDANYKRILNTSVQIQYLL
jgi:hypothetical protein